MNEEFNEVAVSRINLKRIDASKIDHDILDIIGRMNLTELPPEAEYPPGTILIECAGCRKMKSLNEFCNSTSKTNKRKRYGKQYQCMACDMLRAASPTGKAAQRNTYLKLTYKIDHAEYERMLASQDGGCAICKTTNPGGKGNRFHVDHDHATGKIRALLCYLCNTGIGKFKHDPDRLRKAAEYIEKYVD